MNSLEFFISFLGWCLVLNIAILVLSTLCLIFAKDMIKHIHSSLFAISHAELDGVYVNYLAYYKIAILIFNLVPYIALRIIMP